MATKTRTDAEPADAAVIALARPGRLAGKVALVTGAAGNLGGEIARHYLSEGATVVFTGRTAERTNAAMAAALADTGADMAQASSVVMDGASPASCRAGIADILARHGRLDILVNNAGSAGPKQPLERLPLSAADLAALKANGGTDTETVGDAARNILGVAWNMVRAAAPAMAEGGSIINVSTIFSRTHYYGRTAYTVPKAALNALSRELSLELGPRGIRVNLVFPGPIASERIRTVFAAMDAMRGDPAGTTANQFFDLMSFERSVEGAPRAKTFPTPRDIAMTCVFLGSDESAAFNGHDFEVTHGMTVRKESRSTYLSRPTMRSIDGGGLGVVVVAGGQVEEAIAIARVQADCGAEVLLGFNREVDAMEATRLVGDTPRLTVVQFDRADHDAMDAALDAFTEAHHAVTGAIILPAYGAEHFTGTLADADDAAVDAFVDDELVGAIAVARTLSRYWSRHDALVHDPRFIFMGNGSDGRGDIWGNFHRAMVEQLVRVWRDESEVDVAHGRRRQLEWGNQVVRFTNTEAENLPFAAGQAARTLLKERKIHSVNLYLPPNIGEATGARKAMVGFSENITGLHLGKVALITGGSAGIGGQVARLLALAGAKVMIVARREGELATMRARNRRRAGRRRLLGRRAAGADAQRGRRRRPRQPPARGRRDGQGVRPDRLSDQQRRCVGGRGDGRRHGPRRVALHAQRQSDLELCADADGRARHEGAGQRAISSTSRATSAARSTSPSPIPTAPTMPCRSRDSARSSRRWGASSAPRSRSTRSRPARSTATACRARTARPGCSTAAAN